MPFKAWLAKHSTNRFHPELLSHRWIARHCSGDNASEKSCFEPLVLPWSRLLEVMGIVFLNMNSSLPS